MSVDVVQSVRRLLRRTAGISLDGSRWGRIRTHAHRVMAREDLTEAQYVKLLGEDSAGGRELLDRLLAELMVHETFFYRFRAQLGVLRDEILPDLIRSGARELRIWSAGCSHGAECYTLAMLAILAVEREDASIPVSVLGTDICSSFLERARRAEFGQAQVADLPAEMKRRFLVRLGPDVHGVHPDLASRVELVPHNLLDPPPRRGFSVVSCRNVLMYMEPDAQRRAVEHLVSALGQGGTLLVGHSESLRGYPELVQADRTHGVGIYRRVDPDDGKHLPDGSADAGAQAAARVLVTDPPHLQVDRPEAGPDAPPRVTLDGDYDARLLPAKLEALKRQLAEAIDRARQVEILADGASSLDVSTARLIARAARLAESMGGTVVVRASRSSVRRWALRHRLPLGDEEASVS